MFHVTDCTPEERMNLRRRSRAKLRLLFSDKRLHRSEADLRSGVANAEPSLPVLLAIKVGHIQKNIIHLPQLAKILLASKIFPTCSTTPSWTLRLASWGAWADW